MLPEPAAVDGFEAGWPERAMKAGLIERHGIGRHHDPLKYCSKGFINYYDEPTVLEPMHYEIKRRLEGRKKKGAEAKS